jgi:predicted nuclease with RNAse H fold
MMYNEPSMSGKKPIVVGLDLAGSPKRPTGFCVLRDSTAETSDLFDDDEILAAVRSAAPVLVAIDAPLNLPPGRTSIHERNDSHYRVCDLELRRRRIPFFPITLGPMRVLTERGIRLRGAIEALGIRVVEMYPGGAQDVWRLPRARRDRAGLRRGLLRLGLKGLGKEVSDHALDAATGALVGRDFLDGRAEIYGNFDEGAIVMPTARPAAGNGSPGTVSGRVASEGRPSGSPEAGRRTRRGPGCRGTRR